MRDNAPAQLQVPLGFMMFTGLAPGDALKLPHAFCRQRRATPDK